MSDRPYLSIGEVLGLLLEEFPDITISKIRFLESQGLIEPERTASGYRKFYDADVERLRFILREQKENYLPLKVIRDRLGDTPPEGLPRDGTDEASEVSSESIPASVTRGHPSARHTTVSDLIEPPDADTSPRVPVAAVATPTPYSTIDDTGSLARILSTHVSRSDLLESSGVDGATLDELESYGLITPRTLGQQVVYEPSAVIVAEVAMAFVALGIEVRHLRTWRTAAEREAALFEQRIAPLLRQRNPQAREQSIEILDRLVQLGGRMRAVMVEQTLRQSIDRR